MRLQRLTIDFAPGAARSEARRARLEPYLLPAAAAVALAGALAAWWLRR